MFFLEIGDMEYVLFEESLLDGLTYTCWLSGGGKEELQANVVC